MSAGAKFKQDVMAGVRNMVTQKSFDDIKQSGIFDSYDYSSSSFVSYNAAALINEYERKTGKKIEHNTWNK